MSRRPALRAYITERHGRTRKWEGGREKLVGLEARGLGSRKKKVRSRKREAGKLGGQEAGKQKTEGQKPGGEVGKKFLGNRKSLAWRA
jgi:hypothetical protein